jgi:aminomethyltransferase
MVAWPRRGLSAASPAQAATAKRAPLHDLYVTNGARMVTFAGYEMPLHYRFGVLKEHLHTHAAAGLFDVSHMGQIAIRPRRESR